MSESNGIPKKWIEKAVTGKSGVVPGDLLQFQTINTIIDQAQVMVPVQVMDDHLSVFQPMVTWESPISLLDTHLSLSP